MSTRLERRVVAKTADYTVNPANGDRPGTLFTNRGAAALVTFTLPAPTIAQRGAWYEFIGVADLGFKVQTSADKAVVLNDAAATSITVGTADQIVGAKVVAECDGESWLLTGVTVGATYTPA